MFWSRKKYCWQCLMKFYNEKAPEKSQSPESTWQCPACRNICTCALCRRIRQQKTELEVMTERCWAGTNRRAINMMGCFCCQINDLDPAASLALCFVYFKKIDIFAEGPDQPKQIEEFWKQWTTAIRQGGVGLGINVAGKAPKSLPRLPQQKRPSQQQSNAHRHSVANGNSQTRDENSRCPRTCDSRLLFWG